MNVSEFKIIFCLLTFIFGFIILINQNEFYFEAAAGITFVSISPMLMNRWLYDQMFPGNKQLNFSFKKFEMISLLLSIGILLVVITEMVKIANN